MCVPAGHLRDCVCRSAWERMGTSRRMAYGDHCTIVRVVCLESAGKSACVCVSVVCAEVCAEMCERV